MNRLVSGNDMIKALDSFYHWLALKLRCDLYFPGANWLCDRHEHNITGISMEDLRRERRERRSVSGSGGRIKP